METDNENSYAIPANYTDSGKWLGGMIAPRNAVEAIVITGAAGYLEYMAVSAGTARIITMVVTLLPLGIAAIIGIDGDSLFQYLLHVVRFIRRRRKLHFQGIGGGYVQEGKA